MKFMQFHNPLENCGTYEEGICILLPSLHTEQPKVTKGQVGDHVANLCVIKQSKRLQG